MTCWWVRWEDIKGGIHYRSFLSAVLAYEYANLVGGWVFRGTA